MSSGGWSWKDFAYIGITVAMFATFIGIAATSAAGTLTGGTAAGLIVAFIIVSAISSWLFYKYYMVAHLYTYQAIATCVALFFSLSAAQIAYMNTVTF